MVNGSSLSCTLNALFIMLLLCYEQSQFLVFGHSDFFVIHYPKRKIPPELRAASIRPEHGHAQHLVGKVKVEDQLLGDLPSHRSQLNYRRLFPTLHVLARSKKSCKHPKSLSRCQFPCIRNTMSAGKLEKFSISLLLDFVTPFYVSAGSGYDLPPPPMGGKRASASKGLF
jgi:hypothetical protein